MAMEKLTPRHFTSALLDSLKTYSKRREEKKVPNFPALDWVANSLLPQAVHFVLPGGTLFMDGLRGLDADTRLPYPVVALEYVTTEKGGSSFRGESTECPKRIALSVDLRQCNSRPAPSVIDMWRVSIPSIDDGIVVFSCAADDRDTWMVLPAAAWFDPSSLKDVDRVFTEKDFEDAREFYQTDGPFHVSKRAYGTVGNLAVIPEVIGKLALQYGVRAAQGMMAADLLDELRATWEFMEAMSCSNVLAKQVFTAPAALNKKRARSGRSPIFEYRVLVLDVPLQRQERDIGSGAGRAAPRIHLRRGHVRRLEQKKVWVNAAVIGAKEQGMIAKDYLLTTQHMATKHKDA